MSLCVCLFVCPFVVCLSSIHHLTANDHSKQHVANVIHTVTGYTWMSFLSGMEKAAEEEGDDEEGVPGLSLSTRARV